VAVGVWAGYRTWHTSWNRAHLTWILDGALTLTVVALLWFAFSKYPDEESPKI